MIFLQSLGLESDPTAAAGFMGAFLAMFMAFLVIFLVIAVILYVFMSLAFMAIAKKAKYAKPGLAWIPIIGPAIVTNRISKMHWWPLLLIIGSVIPVIGSLFSLAFTVFSIIWLWKTFEVIGKPGWWAILMLIPIVNLIMLGIAAWSK